MKQLIILSLSMALVFSTIAQSFVSPTIWLRADSVDVTDALWRDISGHGNDAVPKSHAMPPMSFGMNFNRCFEIYNNECFKIALENHDRQDVDAIIVYKTHDSITENGLWFFCLDSSKQIGLTSHRILSENGFVTYDTVNNKWPVINFLAQSWNSDAVSDSVFIGSKDSLPFVGDIAEFVLFNHHIEDSSITQWISYLAIKYGVTLYKTDYTDSRHNIIWSYHEHPDFDYSIAGIGNDCTMGLHQKQTYFADGRIVFGRGLPSENNEANPNTLSDGEFIVLGMKHNTLENGTQYMSDGNECSIVCRTLVQVSGSGTNQRATFLKIDGDLFDKDAIPILVIDRDGSEDFSSAFSEVHYPDAIDTAGNLLFTHLYWDTDGNGIDAFCLATEIQDTVSADFNMRSAAADNDSGQSSRNAYLLMPNPNAGQYRLYVGLMETSDIVVNICTSDGKIIDTMYGSGQSRYVFEDFERTPGIYLVEINSSLEHKVLKMIVQ